VASGGIFPTVLHFCPVSIITPAIHPQLHLKNFEMYDLAKAGNFETKCCLLYGGVVERRVSTYYLFET
jgi:hypothetical protein